MYQGFVKIAVGAPKVAVADCKGNARAAIGLVHEMASRGAKVCVLPELCLTGYTCGDLFLQDGLLSSARDALRELAHATADADALVLAGLPLEHGGKLYNVAAAMCHGEVLAFVPKSSIPSYNEFYETRHFASGAGAAAASAIHWDGRDVPFSTSIVLECNQMPRLKVAVEICEDLWAPDPPSVRHALAGATLVANLSASNEVVGKNAYRKMLVSQQSARLVCAYAYSNAGTGESTTDVVFGGQGLVAENGTMLTEGPRFAHGSSFATADIDVDRLVSERRRMSTYPPQDAGGYTVVGFDLEMRETQLERAFDPMPFVPGDSRDRDERCEEILEIQAAGLAKRLEHTRSRCAVVGVSGGLDSTLALLVAARAFDRLGMAREGICAATMPCFGTTGRTFDNACLMARRIGATLRKVDIRQAVTVHLADIGHDLDTHDVTYENAQARERTQVLMDLANQMGGFVVGTGDLSELALGWATYNGDHMSMYAVNSSIPKTLVRHLVAHHAATCGDPQLAEVLQDVLDTPVSPELLPPTADGISQKTEELVGPYELHDFFLYYMLRAGFPPAKVYRVAKAAFADKYDEATILKWLKRFYSRFFSQQFKRSCLPDGPKVGSVAVSPRGDLRMPSDACARIWLDELEDLE